MTRPRGVTIVASFFIAYALVTALPKAWLLFDAEAYRFSVELTTARAVDGLLPVPFEWQLGHALVGMPVLLVAGVGLLRGHNWARFLLVVWVAGVLLLTLLVIGWSPGFFVKLTTGALLLAPLATPRARAWFASNA